MTVTNKMAQGFRVFVPWDPVLILSQIVALQGFFYLSLGIWILLVDLICAFPATLDQLFSYHVSSCPLRNDP